MALIGNLTHVDVLAEVGVGGVGGTILDGLSIGHIAIGRLSCRGTCEDAHLKLASCLMLLHGNLSQFLGSGLCHTSRRKTTHGDVLAVLNQRCSLSSGHTCISHSFLNSLIDFLKYWAQRYKKSPAPQNKLILLFALFGNIFTFSRPQNLSFSHKTDGEAREVVVRIGEQTERAAVGREDVTDEQQTEALALGLGGVERGE